VGSLSSTPSDDKCNSDAGERVSTSAMA
jgi:hypothetical protein